MMFSTRTVSGSDVLAIATMDFHAGRFAEAERGCRAALELLPNDANVLYLLGLTEVQLGREGGLARIQAVVAREPARVDRACGLAAALARLQKLDEAVAVLGRVVRGAPENVEAYRQLASAARALAQHPTPRDNDVPSSEVDERSISVVVCSIDPQKAEHIRKHCEALFDGRDFEIIQIRDARSLCEGYNRGFSRSRGDVVVFCHDDIEIASADFPARLLAHLRTHDLVGVAGTTLLNGANWNSAGWPHVHGCVVHRGQGGDGYFFHCFGPPPAAAIQALDGVFIAATRRVCEAIPFDAATFDGFHFYDLDFTYRAFLAGFHISIAWDILIVHGSWGRSDAAWRDYAQKFLLKHGRESGLQFAAPPVNWPIVQLSERAPMTAFHRAMVAAQRAAL